MCLACNPGMLSFANHAATRRDFLKYMGGAAASVFAATVAEPSLGIARAYAADDPADVIFRGGPILSINPAAPRAEALAIRGDRILAIGSAEDVDAYRGSSTQIVDLGGRTLMPGLIDPHMHAGFTISDDWVDVGPIATPSFEQVWNKLRDAVAKTKEGEWVRAQLFDPSITKGAHVPTLQELDELVPSNPFFMMEGNGHVAYVNSVALKLAGVSDSSADLPESRFVKGPDGKLTGRLEEGPSYAPFFAKMPTPDAAEMQNRVLGLMNLAASVGCTSLHDCGIGMVAGVPDLAIIDSALAKNPPIRYRGMLFSTFMDDWERLGIKPGRGTDMYRLGGIKAWADGSNQAKTGYQRENYLGTNSRGAMNYTPEKLTEAIRRAHQGGWQLGVHANGDAAIDATIAAYETVLKETPRDDHRHRIEHCSMLHPEHMTKMKELGLSPSFLIGHVHWWGKAFRDEILGPDRAKFYDPCASALAAGLKISLHSDWNVTPIEPLRYIENAVTRIMNDGGDVFFPNERIPVDAALRAVTIDAAWQCHTDDIVGSLEPGKYADLTILEQDPTAIDPATISKIKVSETWLSGQKRYSA